MCKRDPLSQKKQEEAKIKEEEEKEDKEIEECTYEIQTLKVKQTTITISNLKPSIPSILHEDLLRFFIVGCLWILC